METVVIAKTDMTVAELMHDRLAAAYANGCADLQALGYISSPQILALGVGLLEGIRERFAELDMPITPEDLVTLASLAKRVTKKAIPYKKTPLADADEAWDASAEVAAAEVEDLKAMCAIVQEKGEKKEDYKLPHHKAAGEHACVLSGVQAAGGALQGARGGVDASDAEMAGARRHIARHYKEFDETPPWEKEGEEKDTAGTDGGSVAISKPGFEESETEIRYRLRDPEDFRDDTFRTKAWEGVSGDGLAFEVTDAMAGSVSMIMGKLKPEIAEEAGSDSMVMQSVRWAKVDEDGEETGWTLDRAKAWWGQQGKREKHTMLGDLPHDERHLDELGRPYLPARPDTIKQDKVRKSLYVHFLQKNEARQLVTGVALPCNRIDLQADYVEPDQLLDTMIEFMERSQVMNLMHEESAPQVKIVESYLAPVDFELAGFEVKEGYWLITVHVIDKELWQRVLDGEFKGFSIEGVARRVPVAEAELPDYVEVTEEARAAALLQAA
jgi:hypothetical protein